MFRSIALLVLATLALTSAFAPAQTRSLHRKFLQVERHLVTLLLSRVKGPSLVVFFRASPLLNQIRRSNFSRLSPVIPFSTNSTILPRNDVGQLLFYSNPIVTVIYDFLCSGFAGCKIASLQAASKPGPTYWEGSHPPSSVLGIGEKVPSGVFGPLSLVAFAVGLICVHENNISTGLSATTVNPQTVAGSLLVPISWGMHVAAWIQKKNGK